MEFGIKEVVGTSHDFSVSPKIGIGSVYKIVFISALGCKVNLQGKEFDFSPYRLLFIPKEIEVRAVEEEERQFTLIYFSDDFFDRSPQDYNLLRDCSLFTGEELLYRSIKIPEGFNSLYAFIEHHLELSKNNYGQIIFRELAFTLIKQVVLLGTVYLNVFPVSEQFVYHSEMVFAKRFQQLVDEHVKEHKKVPFYAEKLDVSPKKLTAISKKVLGRTPKELINEGVLRISKKMLAKTQKSIKQIAWELQYVDENNFSSAFLKLSGISPREYRKRNVK